jgi:hypothetical protein
MKTLSARKRRIFVYISVFLAAGHLFDLSLGLGWNKSIGWFGAITDLYAGWDPMYIAQPFYMEITSLLSGFVMIPMTLAMAYGFRKHADYVKWLVPMYAGYIICNNTGWYWNEFFCPEPPISWFMLILFSSPWWILPSYLFHQVITHEVTAADPVESSAAESSNAEALQAV